MSKLTEAQQTIAAMEAKISELVAASQAALELVGIVTAERDSLAAQLYGAMDELGDFCAALDGMLLADLGADEICDDLENRMSHYENDSAKFIAAHDAEVAAKAVEDAAKRLMCGWVIKYDDLLEYADELRTKK